MLRFQIKEARHPVSPITAFRMMEMSWVLHLEVCKKSVELKHPQLQMLRRVLDL